MSALAKDFALVSRYIRSLHGRSQPILVQANDGLLYVVKSTNNLQGPNLLFNESVGTELYRSCGLPTPEWKPLLITRGFIYQYSSCLVEVPAEFEIPEVSLCFGSRFLGTEHTRLLEILPGTFFHRVRNRIDFWAAWLLDICADHADHRQTIFTEGPGERLQAHFIDHGHLFGGPNGDLQTDPLKSKYLDDRAYPDIDTEHIERVVKRLQRLDVDRIWQLVRALPMEWPSESALRGFQRTLNRLADRSFLQRTADTILDPDTRRPSSAQNRWGPVAIGTASVVGLPHLSSIHNQRFTVGLGLDGAQSGF